MVSLLVVRTRRLDLAEDALAEAFAKASARWPTDGVPANPSAWLFTTARRVIVGRWRAEAIAGRHAPSLAVRDDARQPGDGDSDVLPDERLQLVLLCCHPALEPSARSALALRLVVGTSTEEIARLFLVSTPTMAARITRAKRKIVAAGIPLARPVGLELEARLDAVARTVYLAFTAGYTPGTGSELLRPELAGEAVHLAAVLHQLVPAAPQCRALLALLLLQHSRRDARVRDGGLVTLDEQDRSSWRHDEIAAAVRLLDPMRPSTGFAEELRLQALAARAHAVAVSSSETDWQSIAAAYEQLERLTGSPVVRLNRAVAVAEIDGPAAGLAMLATLDDALGSSHRLHAVRAELERRRGDLQQARAAFGRAIEACRNETERAFLSGRLADLDAG